MVEHRFRTGFKIGFQALRRTSGWSNKWQEMSGVYKVHFAGPQYSTCLLALIPGVSHQSLPTQFLSSRALPSALLHTLLILLPVDLIKACDIIPVAAALKPWSLAFREKASCAKNETESYRGTHQPFIRIPPLTVTGRCQNVHKPQSVSYWKIITKSKIMFWSGKESYLWCCRKDKLDVSQGTSELRPYVSPAFTTVAKSMEHNESSWMFAPSSLDMGLRVWYRAHAASCSRQATRSAILKLRFGYLQRGPIKQGTCSTHWGKAPTQKTRC